MRERDWSFFRSLLTEDMAKQARQVEGFTLAVFVLLLLLTVWLWQYKIELTGRRDGRPVVIGKFNIIEILLSKRGG